MNVAASGITRKLNYKVITALHKQYGEDIFTSKDILPIYRQYCKRRLYDPQYLHNNSHAYDSLRVNDLTWAMVHAGLIERVGRGQFRFIL